MGEKMTLEQVRDWHRKSAREKDVCGELRFPGPNESPFYRYPSDESKAHDAMADAIDAQLTQPAQAVDVGALRDMIEDWRTAANAHDELQYSCCGDTGRRCADELEHALAALSNANGKEG